MIHRPTILGMFYMVFTALVVILLLTAANCISPTDPAQQNPFGDFWDWVFIDDNDVARGTAQIFGFEESDESKETLAKAANDALRAARENLIPDDYALLSVNGVEINEIRGNEDEECNGQTFHVRSLTGTSECFQRLWVG